MTISLFFTTLIRVTKQWFIHVLYFSIELFYFIINILINFFFFLVFLFVIWLLYALNSFVYCIFFLYIYLYFISPIIYLLLYLATYFSILLPFLFIYFLMCYNTIYIPGYKIFYFFGHSLLYWKYYYSYYIRFYLLKHNYVHLVNFIFILIFYINIFGEFNILFFISLIYLSFSVYYYVFIIFKFVGNIFSLVFLLIINVFYLKNLIDLSILNDESIDPPVTASETLWEMFNYRLNYRMSSKAYRYKKNYKINKILFDFVKNRELDQFIVLEENYYEWFKLRSNLLKFFNFNDYRSYWVQNQKLLASLNDQYNNIEEVNDFLEHLDTIDVLSIRPIKNYYYRNLDIETKLNDFTPESYYLYKNILLDEMGTDIYYLPTTKERKSILNILVNRIYRYRIIKDILDYKVEEDYREKEIDNLDLEYISQNEDIKLDIFKDLNLLFFKTEDYKYLYDNKLLKYNELYYNKDLKKSLDNFFKFYLKNKKAYNNGEFYAHNEHLIYQSYKEFDEELLNTFYDPFSNFERDLNKRENYNFNRLYKAISETTLRPTEEVSLQDFDFIEIKRYQDIDDPQILYDKGEFQIEKQKVINTEMFEENEELLSLEATKIKFNKVKSKHLYRFYKDNKIPYIISNHDKKLLLKADDFFY